MAWFRKSKAAKGAVAGARKAIPEGLWTRCNNCKEIVYSKELARNMHVCPKCNYHFRISAKSRMEQLFDDGNFTEFATNVHPSDPLQFKDSKRYKDRLKASIDKCKMPDALVAASGTMGGKPIIICAMEFKFMGGSMGSVVGEKITLALEKGLEERCPVIVISCSGGARMQEGALSLMQMGKISAALARMHQEKIPYISILADPTTGGVTASYAMLGDLNIAEPRALIGFAGPRVIKQTIRKDLPEGFQRSEFLLEHGMLDMIVERSEMRETLIRCLSHLYHG
jgi:acetyl-CoA carboxylase carboxyl transferase subunit beta